MHRTTSTRILLSILGMIAASVPVLFSQLPASSLAEAGYAISGVAASTNSARYKIDTAQSRFIVRAFAGGFLSAFAHDHTIAIREFTGETEFTYGTVEPASLQMTINAGSLAVTDKVSEKDRQKIETTMRDEVLEVSKHPEISFKSSSINASKTGDNQYQARIAGDITLRGVTRPLTITARLEFGDQTLRAQGGFTVKQSSFGIKPVSVAGGTIKVKDELKFTFDIVAHPEKRSATSFESASFAVCPQGSFRSIQPKRIRVLAQSVANRLARQHLPADDRSLRSKQLARAVR